VWHVTKDTRICLRWPDRPWRLNIRQKRAHRWLPSIVKRKNSLTRLCNVSELEAQIATLQRQVTHMVLLLQGRQSLVGSGHIGIAPAYGTNHYIMPKIPSKRNANRGVDQNTITEAIFAIPYHCTPETNNHHWASQDVASGAPSPGSVWYIGGNGHGFLPAGPVSKSA
jgi:hypothetical protein